MKKTGNRSPIRLHFRSEMAGASHPDLPKKQGPRILPIQAIIPGISLAMWISFHIKKSETPLTGGQKRPWLNSRPSPGNALANSSLPEEERTVEPSLDVNLIHIISPAVIQPEDFPLSFDTDRTVSMKFPIPLRLEPLAKDLILRAGFFFLSLNYRECPPRLKNTGGVFLSTSFPFPPLRRRRDFRKCSSTNGAG
jgi:hypothetical protein